MKKMNKKSDIWALGVLAYVLYFKMYPFRSSVKAEIMHQIENRLLGDEFSSAPPALKKFLLDCFELDVKKRIGDSVEQFQTHEFFQEFDWKQIREEGT